MLIKTGIVLICLYVAYRIAKVMIKKKLKKMLFPNGMPHEQMHNGQTENPDNPPEKETDLIQCAACESWMPTPPKYQKKGHKYCSKECLQAGPKG